MLPGAGEIVTRAVLEAEGWKNEETRRSPRWHVYGMCRTADLATLSLEIHRTLDNPERGAIDYEALEPLCKEERLLGRPCLVPGPAGQLLVGATHALRHGMDVPLKSLVDIHRAVGAGADLDDAMPLLRRSPGAAAALGLMLRLSRSLFGTQAPPAWRRALAPFPAAAPLLALTTHHRIPGFARAPFRGSSYLRRLWFQSLLTGSPVVMARVLSGWFRRRTQGNGAGL